MSINVTPRKQEDGTPVSTLAPRVGYERVIASHNLADKCTWFNESVRVTDEALIDLGDGLTFGSAHTHWVDMTSGRMHRDSQWVALQQAENPEDPHGYQVVVKVNGDEKAMRRPFATSGGDYEVIWDTGEVVFFSPQSGNTVTASYSYAYGGSFTLKPNPGKKLVIETAEADFSTDLELDSAIIYSVWGYVDVFAPQLVGNPYPSGTLIPIQEDSFGRAYSIIQEAKGAYPLIPAIGSTEAQRSMDLQEFRRKCRGTRTPYLAIPFAYQTSRELISDFGLELRVYTEDEVELGGEMASLTFYCTEWEYTG